MTEKLRCMKCNKELVEKVIRFDYLGHLMDHAVPCCPECGQPYVSEALATGKMAEVETTLEDK